MALTKYNYNSFDVTPVASKALAFNSDADGFTTAAEGSMVLIKTVTASSSSTITFINGTSDVVLDNTYPIYVIKYINVHPSNESSLTMNLTIDGTNWNVQKQTTCIECYNWENNNSPVLLYRDLDLANGTGEQNLMVGLGTDNDENGCGEMWLFDPSSTTFVKHFMIDTNFMENQGLNFRQPVAGYANTTSAVTGVRFIMAAGTIDSGTFKLYGIKDS